ncbi:MAG: tyrosine--tRNA ligase [Gemmatimonadota bacterium]|nr:MAG: tyrosine--tRNA ligase [Gemmatimonadota bacterium]
MERFLDELAWRGLLYDETPELRARLTTGPITGYAGFDPTAPSLQIGNLVAVMLLAHLQRCGGKPVVVLGGGTGLIGDPSGKSEERPLLEGPVIEENTARQREQLSRFLDFTHSPHGAQMVNNRDWLGDLEMVTFLRDIGKHFTLSYMLQKDSVKGRMTTGISYTEFSYMLLQAFDFLHLYRTLGCELQVGGSDQWGNITAGIELIRRVEGGDAHGVCAPLITTASGAKFGKTEKGSVWLSAELTSPYEFYQFWINADDRDVESYLKIFTFESREAIAELMDRHSEDPGARIPHRAVALDVTARVHGGELAQSAAEASLTMFGQSNPADARAATWKMLAAELPHGPLPPGLGPDSPVVDLIACSGVVQSRSDARRQIQQGGIYLNGQQVSDASAVVGAPLHGGYYWLRRGKKTHFIFGPPA